MHRLFHYLNSYLLTSIPKEDFKVIKSHFIPKKLNKKQLLLQKGDICDHFAFIVKGALRQYYIDKKGFEHTVNLYIENWWAGDRESFIRFTPSIYSIVANENCEVLLITR
nr:cyclic nucleotide-binding domain-containing protein [uncultured Flavobacterium sp.]